MSHRTPAPKPEKKPDIVVFEIVRDSACAECGEQLGRGRWLRMEGDSPLCMSCADLDHLVFLAPGDAALTRRASKYSALRAVLVRFSRARGRYERQGILVEESALVKAEQECLADAEVRRRNAERRAERDAFLDAEYQRRFEEHVIRHYPGCPSSEAAEIAVHACRKYSGRVGRSAAAKRFERDAIDLAVRAHVRHCHTGYDKLLGDGWDRGAARDAVSAEVDRVLRAWQGASLS